MWRKGNLYWQQARYAEAQKAYAEAIGLIDKAHREYATITNRSEILDELVPHTNAIQLQDSLQHLARLPEAERMAAIEKIIALLKRIVKIFFFIFEISSFETSDFIIKKQTCQCYKFLNQRLLIF